MSFRSYLFFGLLISTNFLFAQESILEVQAYIETSNGIPISGASAEIHINGTKKNSEKTNAKGLVSFTLEYGKSYKIIVSKPGMIQKRIDFVTEIPEDEKRSLSKEFAMTLVASCEGANMSVFKEPVDIVKYDEGFGNFMSDHEYVKKMKAEISSAYASIDQCRKENFTEKKIAADKAFKKGDFESAEILYSEALTFSENDVYTKRQIGQSRQNKEKQRLNQVRFEQLIREGEQFLSQNQLGSAKQRFLEASRIDPTDTKSREKLQEIEQILAQQALQKKQEQIVDKQYNKAVSDANGAMAGQDFALAKQLYEEANKLKPGELFPTQKLAEVQLAIEKEEEAKVEVEKLDKSYQEELAAGQAALQKEEFASARQHYQEASLLKPKEELPRKKINEIDRIESEIKQNKQKIQRLEIEASYSEAVQKGDGFLVQKQFDAAISAYQEALQIKSADKYAQRQINKAKNLRVEEDQKAQGEIERAYEQAMIQGDILKGEKKFEEAIKAYKQAIELKPNETNASKKLLEAQKLFDDKEVREKEEQELRAQYNELIQEGDSFFTSKDYEKSKNKYEKALTYYPSEVYPKNKITTINNILSKDQKEKQYIDIINRADKLFAQQKFELATTQYTIAQKIMPLRDYPQRRINEIKEVISKQLMEQQQAEYDQILVAAEQKVTKKDYRDAKLLYAKAALILPDNPYPGQRINEINELINDRKKGEKLNRFNKLVERADNLLIEKKYKDAKSIYLLAQKENFESNYPQEKINEINEILSNFARKDVNKKYQNEISRADGFFSSEKYDFAIKSYLRAQKILPEEDYPQIKINEIKTLLSNNVRKEKEKNEQKNQYDKFITLANKLFNDKNYTLATAEYTNALSVFPDEQYPVNQINQINELLAEQQRIESERRKLMESFNESIELADKLFKEKKLTEAKTHYQNALSVKPEDVHSTSQIKRIDKVTAELMEKKQREDAIEKNYKSIIANADSKFSSKDYQLARTLYFSALELKPNETHPRLQIKKLDEKIKQSATTKARENAVSGKNSGSNVTVALRFENESERAKYFTNLKNTYKKGITLETYKEGKKTTKRYIVIRGNDVHEFRAISYSWGGNEYYIDDKPTNALHLRSQVKPRDGESLFEIDK